MKNRTDLKLNNLNCITPIAYAGHGKDYVSDLITRIIDRPTYELSFSDPIKHIMAESFTSEHVKLLREQAPEYTGSDDMYEFQEYLKNERHDIAVFDGLNMRDLMIYLMGDRFLLRADPNIKVKLSCQAAIEELEKNEDTLFLANSTRYEEEILFTFLLNNAEDPKSFFKNYIGSHQDDDNINQLNQRALNTLVQHSLDEHAKDFLSTFSYKVCSKMYDLNQYEKPEINFKSQQKKLTAQYAHSNDYEKMLAFGVFHIFRPLIKRGTYEIDDLDQTIKDYTKIDQTELDKIKKNYNRYNIDFTLENIDTFGFLRSNPHDKSERILMLYKGLAILNEHGLNEKGLENQIQKIKEFSAKNRNKQHAGRKNKR